MVNDHEIIDKLVEQYHVRLVSMERSAENPDGLLVGEYWSKQIEGEKRDAVLEGTPGSERQDSEGGEGTMTTATVNKLTEIPSIEKPARRGRKPQEKNRWS